MSCVGTSPHRALLLLVCLLAVVAASLTAAPAGAVELGISDSDALTAAEPFWAGLGITRARVVVPYDIATTSSPAGLDRRDNFERYLANARAAGVSLLVVFAPSQDVRAPGTGDPLAPSADEFAAGFAAFRARYPDVTTIAPWNEPNNRDTASYALGSQPQLAADYWLRAKQLCPTDCTLVAGDFAGIPGDDSYVDAYQAELAANGAVPDVWAFHAYTDVNRFQVVGVSDAPVSRYYLSKLQGPWAGARIWIDEIGARFRDASGLVWGDASQRDAAGLLLGLATLDPRIDAIYYFNYSNQCGSAAGCAVQDRGLVSPAPLNGDAPDYDAVNRKRAVYDVIAARGPVIPPVAALPPAVTIDAPAQGAALRTATPTFSGRAAETINSDPNVTLRLFPGAGETESSSPAQTLGTPVAGGTWTATAARLADGVYTARASQAGNPGTSGTSPDVVFTVDTIAPTTTVIGGPGAVSGAHTQEITFAASEPGVTFTCAVDGRRSKPCVSPVVMRHLRLGTHSFAVRARDAAGNPQKDPTRLRWQVVSLVRALAPRLGGIGPVLSGGLPVAAACEDRCRVTARLDLLPTGRGRSTTLLARADVRRTRAGRFSLRLRPRGSAAAALAARSKATATLTLALRARGVARTVVVRGPVTLRGSGALRALGRRGLPVTLACSSACAAPGVSRGVAGGISLRLARGRTTTIRVHAAVGGPGTDPRTLPLRMTLPR
ncbi:MAG TPA: hypothetical protein VKB25_04175 [Conexibacter sp.]|nr:hypothetical protein [Conexibacter sp.]